MPGGGAAVGVGSLRQVRAYRCKCTRCPINPVPCTSRNLLMSREQAVILMISWCRRVPNDKRARVTSLVYAASSLGTVLSMAVTPALATVVGWPVRCHA